MSAFEADRFNHSRTSPRRTNRIVVTSPRAPKPRLSFRWHPQLRAEESAYHLKYNFRANATADCERTPAELPRCARPARHPEPQLYDSFAGDAVPASQNERPQLSDRPPHIPGV